MHVEIECKYDAHHIYIQNGDVRTFTGVCRPLGECAFSDVPNFGTIDIDWEAQTLSMQVRDAADGVRILQRYDISLSNCLPLPGQSKI